MRRTDASPYEGGLEDGGRGGLGAGRQPGALQVEIEPEGPPFRRVAGSPRGAKSLPWRPAEPLSHVFRGVRKQTLHDGQYVSADSDRIADGTHLISKTSDKCLQ